VAGPDDKQDNRRYHVKPFLELRNISKSFPGVKALQDVSLEVRRGEVHALLGENGAGKSTLIKILSGIYQRDAGEILIDGKTVEINSVNDAKANKISVIHQELLLEPYLTVAENIFLGSELKNKLGLVDFPEMNRIANELIESFHLRFHATTVLDDLPIADQQMVEILRAVSFGAQIIVMDEPTSSLTDNEVDLLFEIVGQLKSQGVSIIYISHRMVELDMIADRVTIMRDGQYVTTVEKSNTTTDEMVALMVGRKIENYYTKTSAPGNEIMLDVKDIGDDYRVKSVSFQLHKGEILGFAGLVGAGRTEMAECIYGLRKVKHGTIALKEKPVRIPTSKAATQMGIGFLPEDRKQLGLYMPNNVRFNTTLNVLHKFLSHGRYSFRKEYDLVEDSIQALNIKVSGQEQLVSELSGGNQQKIIVSRWLLTNSDILIMDEPTRGIDVNAKSEIYALMDKLAKEGISIIFISSELPELLNMCDRIAVMSGGYTTGILKREEFSQETIMKFATMEINEQAGEKKL